MATMEGKKYEDNTLTKMTAAFTSSLDVDVVMDACVPELITPDDLDKMSAMIRNGEKKAAIRHLLSKAKKSAPGYLKKFYDILNGEERTKHFAVSLKEEYLKLLPPSVPSVFGPTTDSQRRRNAPISMPPIESLPQNSSLIGDGTWPFPAADPSATEPQEDTAKDQADSRSLPSYRMKAKPRGAGVIINNKVFTCGMKNREGTDRDATALQHLFTYLGFYTNRYDNKTGTEMRRIMTDVASKDHRKSDCVIVAILTHGIKGKLYGTDGELIPVEDLVKLFNGYRCPSLIGKPKIFILQACRGGNFDYGVEHDLIDGDNTTQDIQAMAQLAESQYQRVEEQTFKEEVEETDSGYTGTVPAESDFLLAYATIPGYVSWRNNENGSWFVSAMVSVFREMAQDEHLIDMLTEVNRRVAEEFESRSGKNKQVPEPVTRLRKKLYFFPK